MQERELILSLIEKYKDNKACLGGSRSLMLRNINLGRTPVDIDIIVNKQVDISEIDDELETYDDTVVSTKVNGIKVDFLLEEEDYSIETICGIPCINVESLLAAKKRYNSGKHIKDVEIIENYLLNKEKMKKEELEEKINHLTERIKNYRKHISDDLFNNTIGFGDITVRINYSRKMSVVEYSTASLLNKKVENIIKGLESSIIEDAKEEVLKTLKELEDELVELSLQYATGMKLKKEN